MLPYDITIPLCEEGMAIRIHATNGEVQYRYFGLGEACILRGDVHHGGSYGSQGNLRLRIAMTPKGFPDSVKHRVEYAKEEQYKFDEEGMMAASDVLSFSRRQCMASGRTMKDGIYQKNFKQLVYAEKELWDQWFRLVPLDAFGGKERKRDG